MLWVCRGVRCASPPICDGIVLKPSDGPQLYDKNKGRLQNERDSPFICLSSSGREDGMAEQPIFFVLLSP